MIIILIATICVSVFLLGTIGIYELATTPDNENINKPFIVGSSNSYINEESNTTIGKNINIKNKEEKYTCTIANDDNTINKKFILSKNTSITITISSIK